MEVAAQLQADKAAAAKATEGARHDACALRQPDEPPAVEVGSPLEVLLLIEEPEEDGSISKEYSQLVAVVSGGIEGSGGGGGDERGRGDSGGGGGGNGDDSEDESGKE